MPFVHLANGAVKHLTAEEMEKEFGDEPPRVMEDSGVQYAIVGIYPDGVKLPSERHEERKTK